MNAIAGNIYKQPYKNKLDIIFIFIKLSLAVDLFLDYFQ